MLCYLVTLLPCYWASERGAADELALHRWRHRHSARRDQRVGGVLVPRPAGRAQARHQRRPHPAAGAGRRAAGAGARGHGRFVADAGMAVDCLLDDDRDLGRVRRLGGVQVPAVAQRPRGAAAPAVDPGRRRSAGAARAGAVGRRTAEQDGGVEKAAVGRRAARRHPRGSLRLRPRGLAPRPQPPPVRMPAHRREGAGRLQRRGDADGRGQDDRLLHGELREGAAGAARPHGDGQRLPGAARRGLLQTDLRAAGRDGRLHHGGHGDLGRGRGSPAAVVRVRHHVRDEQRVRLRLPARQHEAQRPRPGAGPAGLRGGRRGGLDPDRRGPHATDHLRPGPRRREQLPRRGQRGAVADPQAGAGDPGDAGAAGGHREQPAGVRARPEQREIPGRAQEIQGGPPTGCRATRRRRSGTSSTSSSRRTASRPT